MHKRVADEMRSDPPFRRPGRQRDGVPRPSESPGDDAVLRTRTPTTSSYVQACARPKDLLPARARLDSQSIAKLTVLLARYVRRPQVVSQGRDSRAAGREVAG
jgi:hypothetical protein